MQPKYKISIAESKFPSRQCCGVGAVWSRGFLAGAGADLNSQLEPIPVPVPILGRLRLLFLASEKRNDLKMFIVMYIFLYN